MTGSGSGKEDDKRGQRRRVVMLGLGDVVPFRRCSIPAEGWGNSQCCSAEEEISSRVCALEIRRVCKCVCVAGGGLVICVSNEARTSLKFFFAVRLQNKTSNPECD